MKKSMREELRKTRESREMGFVEYMKTANSCQQVSLTGPEARFLASQDSVVMSVIAHGTTDIEVTKTKLTKEVDLVGRIKPGQDGYGYLTGFEVGPGELLQFRSKESFVVGFVLLAKLRFGSWGR